MTMVAEVRGGLAAEHGEASPFSIMDLAPGRLTQYDRQLSRDELVGTAKANCSNNPLDALGMSPLVAIGLRGAFGLMGTVSLVGWLLVTRRCRRSIPG